MASSKFRGKRRISWHGVKICVPQNTAGLGDHWLNDRLEQQVTGAGRALTVYNALLAVVYPIHILGAVMHGVKRCVDAETVLC